MIKIRSELLNELYKREIIKDVINLEKLDEILASDQKICVYCGFDLTADSLHVGSLMPIKVLQAFHRHGHKVVVLLGGATTKIGDPSGKDESRKMQTLEQIQANKRGIQESISKFLKPDENLIFVDNDEWISQFSYIDFLREVGTHFSVNRMLTMESIKLRLDRASHLSFIEFNYMLLQAFDFFYLWENYDCALQIGGSEQWGNIVNGIDLINKKSQKKGDIFGITINLVTRSDGKKMGKSESGAVWLNEAKMPAFDYYQYFRNIPDEDVKKFFLLFTDLALHDIDEITKLDINRQKKRLAFEVTMACRGKDAASDAQTRAVSEFEEKIATTTLNYNFPDDCETADLIDILFSLGLFESKGECKKMLKNNGVKINDSVASESLKLTRGEYILKIGKKSIFNLSLK